MPRSKGRAGRAWRKLCRDVYQDEAICWLCNKWVDQSLPQQHPMSRTVDHIRELWQGGDPLDRNNCRLAHRRCNTAKSNRLRARTPERPQLSVDISTL